MSRTASLLAGVFCLGVAGYLALVASRHPPVAVDPPTGLVVDPPTLDLGTVGQNESHTAQFTLTNYHAHAITFGPVGRTCTCTSAELAEQRLQPGQSTTLAVRWESRTRQGHAVDRLTLGYHVEDESSRPAHTATLLVSSQVLPDLLPAVEAVPFIAGTPGEFVLRLTRRPGGPDVRLTWAGASHPCLRAEVLSTELAVRVRYDGTRPDVTDGRPEVQIQSIGGAGSMLAVPVRLSAGVETP